jgi:tetratricopeptide (TPR) repeat protein
MDEATKAFNTQLWEVRRLQWQGNRVDAAHRLVQAVKTFPGDHTCVETLARVMMLEMLHRYRAALALLDKSRAMLEPVFPGMYWYTHGVQMRALHRNEEALASFQLAYVQADAINHRPCLYFIGDAYRRLGQFGEATNYFMQAREARGFPVDAEIDFALGEVTDTAYVALRDSNPELLSLPFSNGTNYDRVQQLTEQAVVAYQRALADPHFSKASVAWYRLGELYFRRHQYRLAIDCYAHVVPTEVVAALGQLRGERKNPVVFPPTLHVPEETMQERFIALACFQMTTLLAEEGIWQQAIPLYLLLMQHPHISLYPELWPGLLGLCRNQGFTAVLQERYHRYVQTPPAEVSAAEWQFAGMLLADGDRPREALVCFAHALQDASWTLPGMTRHCQGDAYLVINNRQQAIACYLSALLDRGYRTGHSVVWNTLGNTYRRIGKPRLADRCSRHV